MNRGVLSAEKHHHWRNITWASIVGKRWRLQLLEFYRFVCLHGCFDLLRDVRIKISVDGESVHAPPTVTSIPERQALAFAVNAALSSRTAGIECIQRRWSDRHRTTVDVL